MAGGGKERWRDLGVTLDSCLSVENVTELSHGESVECIVSVVSSHLNCSSIDVSCCGRCMLISRSVTQRDLKLTASASIADNLGEEES